MKYNRQVNIKRLAESAQGSPPRKGKEDLLALVLAEGGGEEHKDT